jgi:hypothetical protein
MVKISWVLYVNPSDSKLILVASFNAADEFLTMSIFLNSAPVVDAVIPITSPVPE